MKITLNPKLSSKTDLIVFPLFENEEAAKTVKQKTKLLIPEAALADFKNEIGNSLLVYTPTARLLLIALGKKQNFGAKNWRIAIHTAITNAQKLQAKSISLFLPSVNRAWVPNYLELTGFAVTHSAYQFNIYKQGNKTPAFEQIEIVIQNNKSYKTALNDGGMIGLATNQARDLANHPGNIMTPKHLAQHAITIAKKYKLNYKILGESEMMREKLGLILGVSRGSDEPPRFIILESGNQKQPPIVLIGKGLTFDSGGKK